MSAILQATRRQERFIQRRGDRTGRGRRELTSTRHACGSPPKISNPFLKEIRRRSGLRFICRGTICFSNLALHSYSTPVTWYPPPHLSLIPDPSLLSAHTMQHHPTFSPGSYLCPASPGTGTCWDSSLLLRIFHCPLQPSWLLYSHRLGKWAQSSLFWFSIVCLLDGPFVNSAVHTLLWCQV